MKKIIILIASLLLSSCSYMPQLVILNSTEYDIEICNLGSSIKECVKITKGKVDSIGLTTSNRSNYVFVISSEIEEYSYSFNLQDGVNYFSNAYCGKLYKNFCDIAVRLGGSGIIYWSGRTSKHPTEDAAQQPVGFPIKPNA